MYLKLSWSVKNIAKSISNSKIFVLSGRMMWTVLVNDEQADKFYFEVDIFLPNFPSKRIVYRQVFAQ